MQQSPLWEFMALSLKKEYDKRKEHVPLGVIFSYRNGIQACIPAFISINYRYAGKYQLYRQTFYQIPIGAGSLGFGKVDFGMTASFKKRKMGTMTISGVTYIRAKDNFSMDLMGTICEN